MACRTLARVAKKNYKKSEENDARCLVLNLEYGQDNGGLVTVASSIKKLGFF